MINACGWAIAVEDSFSEVFDFILSSQEFVRKCRRDIVQMMSQEEYIKQLIKEAEVAKRNERTSFLG